MSSAGFEPMVNGRSSVTPPSFERAVAIAAAFPDRPSVALLRAMGVRSVVLHRAQLRGTPWARWRDRPVEGLGVRRSERGGLVVYELDPRRRTP